MSSEISPAKLESESTEERTMATREQNPGVSDVEAKDSPADLGQKEDAGGDISLDGGDTESRSDPAPGEGEGFPKGTESHYQKGGRVLDESNNGHHDEDEMCSAESGGIRGNQDLKSIGQDSKGLVKMVDQVLSHKLEGFQAQMQNMFAMIQSVTEMPGGGKLGGEKGDPSKVDEPENPCQTKQDGEPEEEPVEFDPQKKELQEFFGTISSLLDLPNAQGEEPFPDDTDDSERPPPVAENLPMGDMVRNSLLGMSWWCLPILSEHRESLDKKYPLSQEDFDAYGKVPNINLLLWRHVNDLEKQRQKRPRMRSVKVSDSELINFETVFRIQQKIFSYCSHYLAALRKNESGDKIIDKGTVSKLLDYLGEGLTDACALSSGGLQAVTRARRRVWLDAVNVRDDGIHKEIVDKPHAEQLFHPDLDATLQKVIPSFGKGIPQPHSQQNIRGQASHQPSEKTLKRAEQKRRAEQRKQAQFNMQQSKLFSGSPSFGEGIPKPHSQQNIRGQASHQASEKTLKRAKQRERAQSRQPSKLSGSTPTDGGRGWENRRSSADRGGNDTKRQRQMGGMSTGGGYSSLSFMSMPSVSTSSVRAGIPWSSSGPLDYASPLLAPETAGALRSFYDTEGFQGSDDDGY